MATRADKLAMIAGIATGEPNTATEIRNILTALLDPPTGTIVMKDVSNAYIASNFDGTGLGINEEIGYAICNGNNGTRNWDGRVPVAYGSLYPTMGFTDGYKDAVVVAHTHQTVPNTNIFYGSGDGVSRSRVAIESGGTGNAIDVSIKSEGVSGVGKNMQPFMVTLVTMKLP